MSLRMVVFVLLGVLIAGSIAAPLVNAECEFCAGEGKLECPACRGIRAAPHFFFVECPCSGAPDCPLCQGVGYYPSMITKPCEVCDGKGSFPCPTCRGDGKRNLLERFPDLWRGKAKHQE